MQELDKKLLEDPTLLNIYQNLCHQLDKLHRHARQGSYQTRGRYYAAMRVFLKFLSVVFRLEKLANLSGKHLCAYIEWRQECGIAPATIKSELCAVRYYHDQMPITKHPIPSNDELAVDLEKRRFGVIDRTWAEAEVAAFCSIAYSRGKPDYADLTILAHDLGLRIHEAHGIDTAAAREALNTGKLTVKGKGGKARSIPMTAACEEVFRRKLAETPKGEKLFVAAGQKTHLAILSFQRFIIDNRGQVRSINTAAPLTYHGLRHTFASNMYARLKKEGRSDFEAHIAVSRLLGHERADVTDIYLVGCIEGWDETNT